MSKKLTKEFISQKVKSDRIQSIKKLNLWGSDLDDISIIQEMDALEVISLSVNKIRTLKDFANRPNLKELYLRKNLIGDIREIKYLASCPQLQILWLQENPISDIKNYRTIVCSALPNLIKLDDVMVSQAEREGDNDDDEEEEDVNQGYKYDINYEKYNEDYDEENEDEVHENSNNNYRPHQQQYKQQHKQQEHHPLRQSHDKRISSNVSNINNYGEHTNINQYDENENDYRKYSPNKNITKVKSVARRKSHERDYDYNDNANDNYVSPNSKVRRIQTAQERNKRGAYGYQDDFRNSNNNYNQQEYYQKQRKASVNKKSNILQSILLLASELDRKELLILKRELDNMEGN